MEMKYECSATTTLGPCTLALTYCLHTCAGPFENRLDEVRDPAHCLMAAPSSRLRNHQHSSQRPLIYAVYPIPLRKVNNSRMLIHQ